MPCLLNSLLVNIVIFFPPSLWRSCCCYMLSYKSNVAQPSYLAMSIATSFSSVMCQCWIVLQFSTFRRFRPKLLLYWLERIMNCLHSFHQIARCWALGFQFIVPWRVRLLGCVRFLVLPVRSSAAHSAGQIGWVLVTLLSQGEVERHADRGAVFPL